MDRSVWPSKKKNLLTSLLFPNSTPIPPPLISPHDPKPQTHKVVSPPPPPRPPSRPTTKLAPFDIHLLIQSLHSLLPSWPSALNPPPRCPPPRGQPLFRPYVAKVPWHGGVRAFLSQLFPRYGHYCGPNWSSGKDRGTLLWDKRPIDWLDFCCYCHDIGYDTHDQEKLLKADLAFLECLERPRMPTKGDARAAHLYRSMCIYGLRNILIPYRMQLVGLQGRRSIAELMGGLVGKNPSWRPSWLGGKNPSWRPIWLGGKAEIRSV